MTKKKQSPASRSFSEWFYPARPQRLISAAAKVAKQQLKTVKRSGKPTASNKTYKAWLKSESMLMNAHKLALEYSGKSRLWQNPYAKPQPRRALNKTSVWYTAYPISMINQPGQSTLQTLGQSGLWEVFSEIGIDGMHTGPLKQAGGIIGWGMSPSIDGHFDRISNKIDPIFGNEDEFRALCQTAADHNGSVIDDIVPGHTGKGADFRLAEMNYREFPGIYHMVEIAKQDWHKLPDIPRGQDSANLSQDEESQLKKDGYIVGKLQRVIFYEPGVKDTNWSATRAVKGFDGVERRWVYLHYFKEGQPSINWLDPSFAGMKLVVGDALHSIGSLGATGLRLDANGFLGVERSSDDTPAWSEGHPLSEAANHLIASMVRKLGGFTFQELNLSVDDVKAMSEDGADLSYDFINRPAYQHALVTGDTEFLRMTLRTSLEAGIDAASLVHALQNHDELTYELVHYWTTHKDDDYTFRGQQLKGHQLRDIIRSELKESVAGSHAPYNLLFTDNGIACTTASVVAAALKINDPYHATNEEIEQIKKAHLLLAMFNAWQPGVFALSGWDLCGALPLAKDAIKDLIADGDTRWANRGAYDLMNNQPEATRAESGIDRAVCLYGSLPAQLEDDQSFVMRLKQVVAIRDQCQLATAYQIDVPQVSDKSLLVMVHRLVTSDDDLQRFQVTVLNFSTVEVEAVVNSTELPSGATVSDMTTDQQLATIDDLGNFVLELAPLQGRSLLVVPATG